MVLSLALFEDVALKYIAGDPSKASLMLADTENA